MSLKDCTECSRASDNKKYNCPPKMSDGRHYTDYRPRCLTNFVFPNDQPMNSYEYRQYLIHNADTIMMENQKGAYTMNMCGPCVEPFNIGTLLPEQNMVSCDASTCKTYLNDHNGLGTGRKYQTTEPPSDAGFMAKFMSQKESEQAWMKNSLNCCTTPHDDLKYYPWDGSIPKEVANRPSVPGGGMPMTGGGRM